MGIADAMKNMPAPAPLREIEVPALFLDFDGTLVALADRPDGISVSLQLPALLARLATVLEGRVAILTGRALADLESHLSVPGLVARGSHGLERQGEAPEAPAALAEVGSAFAALATQDPGMSVERKPAGVALHYRMAPEREAEAVALADALAARTGLAVQRGKMVVELRPPGTDKGVALSAMMAEPPFAGARPVFVGDDVTDEDAFAAAAALGGFGVLVGAPRESAALFRLPDVDAVHAWLEAGLIDG
jgi:trehalose 6-phosphate phosphatase